MAHRNCIKTDDVTAHFRCTVATLHRLLEEFSVPNLPNILGESFSTSTSLPVRLKLTQKVKIGENSPLKGNSRIKVL